MFAQDEPENTAVEKMAELEWLIGKWDWKGKWLPADRDVTAINDCVWILDKTAIDCNTYSLETPDKIDQRFTYSYDAILDNYVVVALFKGSPKPTLQGSLLKNGDSWSFLIDGNTSQFKVWDQMIYTPNEDNKIEIVQYRSTNGREVRKVQEAVATRMD